MKDKYQLGKSSIVYDSLLVYFSEAQNLAKQWSCPFFEASAKLSRNVDELFTAAVSEMNKFGKKPRPVKKPCCFM